MPLYCLSIITFEALCLTLFAKSVATLSLENCPLKRPAKIQPTNNNDDGAANPQPLSAGEDFDTLRVLPSTLAPIIMVGLNSTEHIVNISGYGAYMLDMVAERLKIRYCWIPLDDRDLIVDDTPDKKGLIGFLRDLDGDMLLTPLTRTAARFKHMDYTVPTTDGHFSIMIPYPEKSVNKGALAQPFQPGVWITLLVAVVVVIATMYFFLKPTQYLSEKLSPNLKSKEESNGLFNQFSYVITVLLSQGNYHSNQKTANRLIAASWCLAAVVIVSAYSGTLLSFIMSPIRRPLVESIYDIVNVPDLKVAVSKGWAVDFILEGSAKETNTSFGVAAGSILKTIFRCEESKECVDKVLEGHYVYLHGTPLIDEMISEDVESTGTCRFSKGKETFNRDPVIWGLTKKARYNDKINIGLLELDAFGLSDYWRDRFDNKKYEKCVRPVDGQRHNSQLTLEQLLSTFILLGTGYALAVCAFVIENVVHRIVRSIKK